MDSLSFVYALLVGILPSFIWLSFWMREDSEHDEPRWLLSLSFLSGMIAVIIAIFVEKYIGDTVTDISWRYALWAAAEEILKFLVFCGIILHSEYNTEPIKGMIYCVAIALGFAALENTFFIFGPFSSGEITRGIITGNMRFMGATLIHVISSATVAFPLGLVYYQGALSKIIAATIGLAGAIILHTTFNLSIINGSSTDTLRTFGWIWLAAVVLIIFFEEVKAIKPRATGNSRTMAK